MGYGANNIADETMAPDVAMALDTLASVATAKTDTLDALVSANKQLADALAHVTVENVKSLNMVSQLTTNAPRPKQCRHGIPNSYCWTHGFVMSANHNSKMCNNKAPGHKVEATKDNTMGGT